MQAGRLSYGLIALGMVVGMLVLPMWPAARIVLRDTWPGDRVACRLGGCSDRLVPDDCGAHVVRSMKILLDVRALGYRHGDSKRDDSWSLVLSILRC